MNAMWTSIWLGHFSNTALRPRAFSFREYNREIQYPPPAIKETP